MDTTVKRKREELAKYLEILSEEIQVEDEDSKEKYNEYYTPKGTYYVMDEEESTEAVKDDIESCLDDMGISAFTPSFQERIFEKYVEDEGVLEEYCSENMGGYAEDIETETYQTIYANRLIDECVEHGLISTEDINANGEYTGKLNLVETLTDYLVEDVRQGYNSFAEWFRFEFGDDELRELYKNGHLKLDIDGIVAECIEVDGYGHFISHWDGKTIELENFYAYKENEYDERE